MGKKKKKSLGPPSPETRDRRVIPIIRVASGSGDTDVSIDVNSNNQCMSTSCQSCFVPSDMGSTSSSLASTQSGSIASSNASHGVELTPLEVNRRRSRSGTGRKSYWRRRMEQFDQDNEVDVTVNSSNNNTMSDSSTSNLNALQQERAPRSSIIFQDGCIASLPLIIQVGFRRKMFSVFALQLLFISSLMVLLMYENVLSSLMQSAFETSGWYLFATLAVMVLFLVLLYLGHAVFPLNWMILLLFSVALSVFLSSVQVYLNTNAGLFCCGFTFSAVSIMIPLSGLERRSSTPSEGGGGDRSERALMSTTRAGLIAFGVVMICSTVLFAVFEQKFVSSGSAFGLSLLLEFALIIWFSYDASTMYSIMSPDEYMSGVIFFYTDLLVVIVVIVVFGALALLFSSAGMGAGGFGGSCDCFGCLRIGRVFGNGDETSANGTPITPIQDMSAGRRDSLAAVVPEEMLRSENVAQDGCPFKSDKSDDFFTRNRVITAKNRANMLVAGDVSAPTTTDAAAAAADEWQLVSRGASKKKKKTQQQQQRSGSRHSAAPSHHALVDVIAAKSSSSTTSSGYKYKAHNNRDRHRHGSIDASDGRVSSTKQSAIERRVTQIAFALRESKLIVDTVRVIDAHFQLQAAVAADIQQDDSALAATLPTEAPVVHLVSYGLGSFCSSTNAVYQLAYAKALLDALRERSIDAKNSVAEIFDPVMNKSDIAIAECFGFSTIQQNECGKRAVSSNTVFFMPHCGKTLYQNVLASNWGKTAQQLIDVIIIGNSFEAYSDRLINAAARRASVLVGVLPYLSETLLETGLSKAHDEFALYEAAFNDLSIHVFPAVRAQEALLNAALTLQMAEIADADQAAAGGQSEELIV